MWPAIVKRSIPGFMLFNLMSIPICPGTTSVLDAKLRISQQKTKKKPKFFK